MALFRGHARDSRAPLILFDGAFLRRLSSHLSSHRHNRPERTDVPQDAL
jgi:hypothetical protein